MTFTRFVFQDSYGKRWRRIRVFSLWGALFVLVLLIIFINSLLIYPALHPPADLQSQKLKLKGITNSNEVIHLAPAPPQWLRQPGAARKDSAVPVKERAPGEPVVLGFYVSWDERSFDSLSRNYRQLTHVVPEWFVMNSFSPLFTENPDQRLLDFTSSTGLKLLPLLTNLGGSAWHPEPVEQLALSPVAKQQEFFTALIERLHEMNAAGVAVDWEQVDPSYQEEFTQLVKNFAEALHHEELELWLSIPVGNDVKLFDLDALSPVVDRFIAQLYDENGEDDPPGPIASQPWWDEWIDVLLEHGLPEQWVIGMGTYGYDWSAKSQARTVSFAEAMVRAGLSSEMGTGLVGEDTAVAGSVEVRVEPPLFQPHFSYLDGGDPHTVWFQDAITFRNQLRSTEQHKAGGIAVYRLGGEDPQIWKVLAKPSLDAAEVAEMKSTRELAHIGEGDFIFVANEPRDGKRVVEVKQDDLWSAKYESFVTFPTVFHRGYGNPRHVAISFDDGPDPQWTPLVLEILKRANVKATFFVVGTKAAERPDLIRQILAEGHEIGNHSYSHSNLSAATAPWIAFELNSTERLIEGITGRSSLLFRPPYNADSRLQSYSEFVPLLEAQRLGYILVTEGIDSEDWHYPDAGKIFENIKQRRKDGNIILLHDGGGDRSATVDALPTILNFLETRGDKVVSLHELLGYSRDALMPPMPDEPRPARVVAQYGLEFMQFAESCCWAFLLGITAVLILRSAIVLVLAYRQKRSDAHEAALPVPSTPPPPVSVLIAAFNEAKVIGATIRSVLASTYAGEIEIVLVDDGSTDETSEIVQRIAAVDPRVSVHRQPNSGKAAALQRALDVSRHEYIVMLDADTQFAPDAIGELILPLLRDEKVGSVSGHLRVGTTATWCERFQSLEYICGFNLDRRAYDRWNCITVVPGAISAYRREAIESAGGLSQDTHAEDTDLTLCMHRARWKIRYSARALARTEAPETARALVRQRTRWAFGTLQCLWKHRNMLFNPDFRALAFFALPSVWFCHIFLVALVPLVDGLLAISLLFGAGALLFQYALFFFLVDWVLALFACALEGEPMATSLLIFPARIVYRPILCWAVWSAILRALKGALYGWGKIERRGDVLPQFRATS